MVRFVAFAALLATPALAQTTAPTPPSVATPTEKPKLACRREVPTGSIMMGKKVCHTPEEWRALDSANEGNVDRFRSGTRGRMGPNG